MLVLRKKMLLVCPFLYYRPGSPDDYFSFSKTELAKLLGDLHVGRVSPIGNRGIPLAEFRREKWITGSRYEFLSRLALRLAGLPFLCAGLKSQDEDDHYAIGYLMLARKREPRAAH
jgi:hypothetical protein